MKEIIFEGNLKPVLDETPTHYICPPEDFNEGYHFISKELAVPFKDSSSHQREH